MKYTDFKYIYEVIEIIHHYKSLEDFLEFVSRTT